MDKRIFIIILMLVMAALACGIGGFEIEQAAEPDEGPSLTSTALSIAQAKIEIKQATLDARLTEDAQSAQQNQEQPAVEETELPDQDEVETDPVETDESSEVVQDNSQITPEEQDMLDALELLKDDGAISSLEGEFIAIDDFREEIAKINYLTWWTFDLAPTDFVIKADAAWNSASDTANWPTAGCGFVFSEEDNSNFHLAYLGLDGYGVLKNWINGKDTVLTNQYYGSVDIPDGEAEIMLAVQDKNAAFYVNGKQVFNQYDGTIGPGNLALTVLSGTNKGFGTRCEMTNMGIWLLE